MGYQGAVLGSAPTPIHTISHRAAGLLPAVARQMVDSGLEFMLEQVKINTPISDPEPVEGWTHVPGGDGIHLRDEIHRTEVTEDPAGAEGQVGSDKEYAPFVEEGTGLYGPKHAKYLIEPRTPGGMLVFPWHGKIVSFPYVWHPGSPGQHMFLIGGSVTDSSIEEWRQSGDALFWEGMQ